MPYFHRVASCILILFAAFSSGFAQLTANRDGKVDPSFGVSGVTTLSPPPGSEFIGISDLKVQSDGKVVVLMLMSSGAAGWHPAVYRFTSAGLVDESFGKAGSVTMTGFSDHIGYALSTQADGKTVVVGHSMDASPRNDDFKVIRLSLNGSLDKSFATDGVFSLDFSANGVNTHDVLSSITIQPDGKILVSGTSDRPANGSTSRYICVVRLNANGTKDITFGNDGIWQSQVGLASGTFFGSNSAITLSTNGQIFAGVSYGESLPGNPIVQNFCDLFRLSAKGVVDPTFSGDGRLSLGQGFGNFQAIRIAQDGMIVTLSNHVRLNKIHPDGTFDEEFGTNGQLAFNILFSDMEFDRRGKSVLVRSAQQDANLLGTLRRYHNNGVVDISFGNLGIAIVNAGESYTESSRVDVTQDGDIIVGGLSGRSGLHLMLTRHFGKRKL